NAKALPKIYQREARKIAKPLIRDIPNGASPTIDYPHEILSGINEPLPPITGYVMTTVKDNPLVEVSLRVHGAGIEESNNVILASWTYGLGRTAAFTTDAGKRWAKDWTEWPNYDKFFSQMVRWSMRPVNEQGEFTVATDIKDGKVRVVITAVDKNKDDEFLNFLNMTATAVGPDMQPFDVSVKQVAPGRYVGEFDGGQSGNYFITVNPGQKAAAGDQRFGPIRAGINVPYSSEFRERETNLALLKQIAASKPRGGEEGQVLSGELARPEGNLLEFDTFRHNLAKAISSQDAWQWFLVIGASLFFADVFVRRVAVHYEWFAPIVNFVNEKIFRRHREAETDTRLERLRSRKAAVSDQLDERKAAARFDPQPDASAAAAAPARPLSEVLGDVSGASNSPAPPPQASSPTVTPEQPDKNNAYTARLLEAKKKAAAKRPPDGSAS
ncbi:MAG TPA: glutamine amidotransferase, partial [Pirellulaceae bacterium]|nr:glutamine amidotransferase [Pirellulaceae bacterium]